MHASPGNASKHPGVSDGRLLDVLRTCLKLRNTVAHTGTPGDLKPLAVLLEWLVGTEPDPEGPLVNARKLLCTTLSGIERVADAFEAQVSAVQWRLCQPFCSLALPLQCLGYVVAGGCDAWSSALLYPPSPKCAPSLRSTRACPRTVTHPIASLSYPDPSPLPSSPQSFLPLAERVPRR